MCYWGWIVTQFSLQPQFLLSPGFTQIFLILLEILIAIFYYFSCMNIKTFLRIFFVLSLSLIFISCTKTYYNANIDSGKFDVYTPSPFYGAGTYIFPNTHYFRGSLSVFPKKQEHLVSFGETENSQVMAVGGMHASDVEVVPQSEADLYYKLTNYYITGHIDFFQTINALEFGGRLGLNPYPYGLVTIGVNNIAVEAGGFLQFGISKNSIECEGVYGIAKYDQMEYEWNHSLNNYSEDTQSTNSNISVGFFFNYFISNYLSLNFSNSLFMPWLFKTTLPISGTDAEKDFDISIDFPFIITQYVGASTLLFGNIQLSPGISLYYVPHSEDLTWFIEYTASFLF